MIKNPKLYNYKSYKIKTEFGSTLKNAKVVPIFTLVIPYFGVPQNGLLTTGTEIWEWDPGICALIIVPDNF